MMWMEDAVYLTAHGRELEHSTSRGRSQGNQTGIGFKERHGAGKSMDRHVPGMHTDAFPKVSHGRMLNSVLTSVGQMGTSNGREMEPTLSGGTGRSGTQGRGPYPPPRHNAGPRRSAETTIITSTKRGDLISIPRTAETARQDQRIKSCRYVNTDGSHVSRKVDDPNKIAVAGTWRRGKACRMTWHFPRTEIHGAIGRPLLTGAHLHKEHVPSSHAFTLRDRPVPGYIVCLRNPITCPETNRSWSHEPLPDALWAPWVPSRKHSRGLCYRRI